MVEINVASVDILSDVAGGLSPADRLRILAVSRADGSQDVKVPSDLVSAFEALVANPSTGRKARLSSYASTIRWRVEVAGIVVDGIPVPTDDRAKLMLMVAANGMAAKSSAPLIIGGVNHGTKTKAQFQAINAAVTEHVQSTFRALATVMGDIESGAITSIEQVDAAFAENFTERNNP